MPAFHLPLAGAYVMITAVTATIWSLLAWHIRLFIRLKIHGPFSWDDIHCTIATVFAILQSSLTIAQTGLGLGRHVVSVELEARENQELYAWIAVLFFVLSLGFSMLSVCFLIGRVTKRTKQVRIVHCIAVLTGLWTAATFLVIAFQCKLPTPWITRPRTGCIDIAKAWIGVTVTRCLLELANIIAAIVLLCSVRMPWRPKATVLAAFAVRLLVIPPSLTRLKYIEEVLASTDWTYSRIKVIIITQVAMHVSVILATVPCIRPWLNAFESGGLHAPTDARRESHRQTMTAPKLAPLLPIAMTTPYTSDEDSATEPGLAGHRKRMEAWPVQFWEGDTEEHRTVTKVEHDPVEAREFEMARKKSMNSSASSRGITRTKSFSVKFEDIEAYTIKQQQRTPGINPTPPIPLPARPCGISRATSYREDMVLTDAGGLLQEVPKARLKSRIGSVASI